MTKEKSTAGISNRPSHSASRKNGRERLSEKEREGEKERGRRRDGGGGDGGREGVAVLMLGAPPDLPHV